MEKRMRELYKLIKQYNHEYYINNVSLVDNYEYDKLFAELKQLEEAYPQFVSDTSPVKKVDDNVDNRFKKVEHKVPMLSLDNAFSVEDLINFDENIKKKASNFSYVCELKIDGLAMSFNYQDGKFKQALTRGNGVVGEDVTHNVLMIDSLVKNLEISELEVRGEVYIDRKEFERLNNLQKEQGLKTFANPRNLASGTIRQLDSEVAKHRNLNAFIYSCVNPNFDTHYETLMYLDKIGFNVNPEIRLVNNIDEVIEYVKYWDLHRHQLEYDTDGVVIKVNELSLQDELGFNARAPKWAIAYKYKAEQVETKINDITFQVGRTGKITPVAELDSVEVSGSVVSRATLHNENYILEKGIKIGDSVLVHKAGEIIPEVVEVVKDKPRGKVDFKMITNCPICNEKLEKDEAHYFCPNELCEAKISRKLAYFASISAMNIEGLGEKNINLLYEKGYINDLTDIYELAKYYDELITIDGLGERSVTQLLENIEKSKSNKLEQFITGLGIKHVGKKIASVLVNHFGDLNLLASASFEDYVVVDEIGDIIAKSLVDYFKSDQWIKIKAYLDSHNFNFYVEEINTDSEFANKSVCVTGTFENYKRSAIEQFFKLQGAKVVSSVSKSTDFLIKGEKAGSKLEKALQYDVTIIDEEQLNKLMEGVYE